MLSASRRLFKAGSIGFHFLCENRYGIPNAPFFGLFPKRRIEGKFFVTPCSCLPSVQAAATDRTDLTDDEKLSSPCCENCQKQIGNPQIQKPEEVPHLHPHHQNPRASVMDEEGGLPTLFLNHGAVTLSPGEVVEAIRYCRAAVFLSSSVDPNSRDWLAGWAATITSNANLVECALQSPVNPAAITVFLESLNKRGLSKKDKALIVRCLLFDAITSVVRARGVDDLEGIEDLISEQRIAPFEDYAAPAPAKERDAKNISGGGGDDGGGKPGAGQGAKASSSSSAAAAASPSQWIDSAIEDSHPLEDMLKFAREQRIPDRTVAEMFWLSLEELEVAEEKFSLIGDGRSTSSLQ